MVKFYHNGCQKILRSRVVGWVGHNPGPTRRAVRPILHRLLHGVADHPAFLGLLRHVLLNLGLWVKTPAPTQLQATALVLEDCAQYAYMVPGPCWRCCGERAWLAPGPVLVSIAIAQRRPFLHNFVFPPHLAFRA